MNDKYETRKLHVSIPVDLYESLRINKRFKSIDGLVTRLLIEEMKKNQ